jgi:hypothetical protein
MSLRRQRERPRVAARNASSLAASLMPGAASTPLATSTAHGSTAEIADATLSGVSPPASTKLILGNRSRASRARFQSKRAPAPPRRVEQDRLGGPDVEVREVLRGADRERLHTGR